MDTLVAGAAFGAALTAAGVYQPSVIIGQLRLENWHMLQAFLTATAGSAIFVTVSRSAGYFNCQPRTYSSLGLFSRYDGNVVGGLLLGTGMALAGACPGTVLNQVVLGIPSGYYALSGSIAAGIVWSGILSPLIDKRMAADKKAGGPCSSSGDDASVTFRDAFGLSQTAALALFEGVCVAAVAGAYILDRRTAEPKLIHPIVGGALIASAQLLSILLRKCLVGVSTGYAEVGNWFWALLKGRAPSNRSVKNIVFSVGLMGGSWALARAVPELVKPMGAAMAVSPAIAGLGGFLMVLGARMAGGCTSGHGISGMSLFSTSSILTIGTALTWGAVVARLMG